MGDRTPQDKLRARDREGQLAVPHAITRRDDGLLLQWDEVGHEAFFPAHALRLACPCAACVEEMTGRPLLDPATVPLDIQPRRVALVGRYGIQVAWSDGHGTGIHTFEALRTTCPCPACLAPGGP